MREKYGDARAAEMERAIRSGCHFCGADIEIEHGSVSSQDEPIKAVAACEDCENRLDNFKRLAINPETGEEGYWFPDTGSLPEGWRWF